MKTLCSGVKHMPANPRIERDAGRPRPSRPGGLGAAYPATWEPCPSASAVTVELIPHPSARCLYFLVCGLPRSRLSPFSGPVQCASVGTVRDRSDPCEHGAEDSDRDRDKNTLSEGVKTRYENTEQQPWKRSELAGAQHMHSCGRCGRLPRTSNQQTDRQSDQTSDRPTDRPTDQQTNIPTDLQTSTPADRPTKSESQELSCCFEVPIWMVLLRCSCNCSTLVLLQLLPRMQRVHVLSRLVVRGLQEVTRANGAQAPGCKLTRGSGRRR